MNNRKTLNGWSLCVSVGAYGGFYADHSDRSSRLCLGFLCVTIFYVDIDHILNKGLDVKPGDVYDPSATPVQHNR